MPIYEYQCEACDHHLEAIQKISEKPLKVCPNCKGRKLKRLVSMTAFRLKGTGWYATDFSDKKSAECSPEQCKANPACPKQESQKAADVGK